MSVRKACGLEPMHPVIRLHGAERVDNTAGTGAPVERLASGATRVRLTAEEVGAAKKIAEAVGLSLAFVLRNMARDKFKLSPLDVAYGDGCGWRKRKP